jgi:nucleoside phosphorylase
LKFQVHENALRVMDHFREKAPRDFVPVESISLAKWLEGAPRLSNRVKITLAYILAKSVWQYYNSSWMTVPWTHENIHLINERGNLSQNTKPHPYFITKLREPDKNVEDFYDAEDLMHMYPNVLALGILLIEIATNQPYKDYKGSYRWDKTVINEYYNWAWTKANKSNLKKSINTVYEGVVDSCLKTDLFEENQFDLSIPPTNSETRQSIIYRKIVLPLKKLFDAYRDDWEIYELQSPLVAPTIKIMKDTNAKTNSARRPASREEFKIAIVCALPLEADAVRAFLDECWDETGKAYGKQKGDFNAYTTGRMGRHNIVIAHMPRMGKSAAASVAAGIRSSYTSVELAIVVGICGATPWGPHKNEVLLGDVIISEGLVEYDYGRRYPNDFVRKNTVTGSLGRPSLEISSMLAKMKGVAGRERIEHRIPLYIDVLVKKLGTAKTSYPGIINDKLYESTYRHKHWNSRTCNPCRRCKNLTDSVCEEVLLWSCERAGCQKEKLVRRQRHLEASRNNSSVQPMIHFGLIASGDTVMKSGYDRDNIAIKENVLAFEMEGAGIWDNLPSIIIKGVCDYADSHKSKCWQDYAASTAAACMRAFLDEWPSSGT